MFLQVKKSCKGILIGSHWHTHDEGPFELDDDRARPLIEQGFVEPVMRVVREQSLSPLKLKAQRRCG